MRNQFELAAEADPNKLIAITHYGTTATNSQGETGFRVYLRNSSGRGRSTRWLSMSVGYDQEGALVQGRKQDGATSEERGGTQGGKNNGSKTLQFEPKVETRSWDASFVEQASGQHHRVSSSTSITCAIIDSAEITFIQTAPMVDYSQASTGYHDLQLQSA